MLVSFGAATFLQKFSSIFIEAATGYRDVEHVIEVCGGVGSRRWVVWSEVEMK